MATASSIIMALPLLILVATQGSSGDIKGSGGGASSVVTAVKGISHVLECYGDSIKHGFHKLSNEILQMKDQLNSLNGSLESKRDDGDSHTVEIIIQEKTELGAQLEVSKKKVDTLTQEIEELKKKLERKENVEGSNNLRVNDLEIQLKSKNATVDQLTESNINLKNELAENNVQVQELKAQLDLKTKENEQNFLQAGNLKGLLELKTKESEQNAIKAQQLDKRLGECEPRLEELKRESENIDNACIATPVDWTKKCAHPKFTKIKEVVQAFSNSRNWGVMRRDATPLLDPTGDAFKQLPAGSTWNVGYKGYTQLAAMFLCGGLPVDTADANGNTMLSGACWGNQLDTVKLLIDHGADVNVKGTSGWTPLMWAAYGQIEIVRRLVDAGADTTAKDNAGRNTLHWAKHRRNAPVVQYLEALPQ